MVFTDEEEGEPRIKGINRNKEKNSNDPSLLSGTVVMPQMHVNLQTKKGKKRRGK